MKISHSSNPSSVMVGANGAQIVRDTATYTGSFYAFKAISQCVIDTVEFDGEIEGNINGLTITAGDIIMIYRISSFKLSSGNAILYKA